MAKLPREVHGATYDAARVALVNAADRVNGRAVVDDPDGTRNVPRLANGHAMAIFQALRRAGARAKRAVVIPEARWQLAWFAYGWESWGDRFAVSKVDAMAPYDENMLPDFWDFVEDFCLDLDAQDTVVRPLYLDTSYTAYQQGARDAWEAMKAFDPNAVSPIPGAPGGPPMPDHPPDVPTPPLPVIPSPGVGGILLLVLLALAIATGKK